MLLALAVFAPLTAAAEPLWGGIESLDAGAVAILPGVEIEPVNGYGGAALPELYAGVGLPGSWDVHAGAAIEVAIYHRDDGALYWGYAPTSFGSFDITARHHRDGSLSWGIRLDSEPYESWGVGPEATWSWRAEALRWTLRPAFTYPLILLGEPVFGTLWLSGSLAWEATERLELFIDLEPRVWMELAREKEAGASHFWPELDLPGRAGAWVTLDERRHHRLGLAASIRTESGSHLARNFTCGLRYRWQLAG